MSLPAVALYAYQKKWMLDDSTFKIGMFSRQTGKTFTTTLEAVDDVYEGMTVGQRRNWVIFSRGERQAKEALDEGVKPHSRAYNVGISELAYDFKTPEGTSFRALEVEYPNGAKITALPANPDTARGFSRNVFLDEFAIHKDSRAIWGALFPIVSKKGLKLRVTSTPKGKNNKFYELMTAVDSVWSRHVVDIYQAVKDGLERNIEELRAGLADDELWRQEYLLEWLDEASAWLTYELIFAAEDTEAGMPEHYTGGDVLIGNDIGLRNDLWIAWVWERVGDIYWCREIRELHRAKFAEHDAAMDELFETYRVRRLVMDQTGMGEKPVEDAKRRYGNSRVEGVLFTPANKLTLATVGKQMFEDHKVRIPAGHVKLRADLHSLVRVLGPTGNVRFVAEREGGSHADRTWAAFLGLSGMDARGAIEFKSIGSPRIGYGLRDYTG